MFFFSLTCPLSTSKQQRQPIDTAQLKNKVVLIIDDVQDNHEMLNVLFKKWQTKTFNFNSPETAIEWLEVQENKQQKIDYVLIDGEFNQNGIVCYQSMKPHLAPSTKAFLLSSNMHNQSTDSLIAFTGVIAKPIFEQKLRQSLLGETAKDIANKIKPNGSIHAIEKGVKKELSILVVEDNRINFKVVEKYLTSQKYQITWAENGERALTLFKPETFDIILMDCMLPGIDGYQATEKIRQIEQEELAKDTPIIALTADVTSQNKQSCIDAGMNVYATKPVDFKILQRLIDELVNGDSASDYNNVVTKH